MPHDMEPTAENRAAELNHIGATLFSKGELEAARYHFLAALSLEPDNHMVLQNLGAVLRNQGHHAAAASCARRSVIANPQNPFCLSNLGVSQLGLRQYEDALVSLSAVVDAMPDSAPSWHNYGLGLYMVGDYTKALDAFDKSLALAPENTQAQSDRALTLLALGRLQDGLEAYEVRWKLLKKSPIWALNIPEWKGESLARKTILVHHEQGFGDSIMLSRFILPLFGLGPKITLAVPSELVRLFQTSLRKLATVRDIMADDWNPAEYDYHVPMLSVVRHLGYRKPAELVSHPYLDFPIDDITSRLPKSKFRIGICWASGDHGPSLAERRRLTNLVDFIPLLEIPGTSVISLQKGAEVKNIAANGLEGLIFDLGPRIEDFGHTASIIGELDLVISVDSAVAHLASALGVNCIMLSPYTRCWRWWQAAKGNLSGSGMPWYRKMTIFNQSPDGTWTEAINQAIKLAKFNLGVDQKRYTIG